MKPRAESICAIVPTFNRWELLRRALEALHTQSRPLDRILVIDNASTDRTGELLRQSFPLVEVLRMEENRGSAGGFCEGVRWAYGRQFDRMWLIDDDSRPAPDTLERLLAHPDRDVVGPVRVWESDGTPAGLPAIHWDLDNPFTLPEAARIPLAKEFATDRSLPSSMPVSDLAWEGMLIPREAVAAIGLPTPGYWTQVEDTDYSFRLRAAGFRLVVLREARILRLLRPPDVMPGWKVRYVVRNWIWLNRRYGANAAVRGFRSWLWAARYFLPSLLKARWITDPDRFRAFYRGVVEGLFHPLPVHERV